MTKMDSMIEAFILFKITLHSLENYEILKLFKAPNNPFGFLTLQRASLFLQNRKMTGRSIQ